MSFLYQRTIRLQDTDAAGVVYFANLLSICHEAYEASLAAAGIDLTAFFGGQLAIPIVHAEIDYFQPLFCGETYQVAVMPTALGNQLSRPRDKFKLQYDLHQAEQLVSRASTVHLCIDVASRSRQPLPPEIQQWLDPINS
ncbi:MAG: acyl-CoA thioesterase [Pegethrix bostrychoides GSE-TBD4-15B]|uniref:Acyl-CoA thioesterase n=1 Tax=Pegethrix bostrychoides GSE-TBD4-15B TaxID=2839662 RepID=A0A951U5C4_9CYAN|nr:acyl-CoA thioesterase [Pegethrix bostrychoides GSE-TBD4-15B]